MTLIPSLDAALKEQVKPQLSHTAGRTLHFTSDIWTRVRATRPAITRLCYMSGNSMASTWWTCSQPHIRWHFDGWVDRGVTIGHLVTDGGQNMKASATCLGLDCISCAAHLLHLILKDALGLGSTKDPSCAVETHEFWLLIQK